MQKGFATLEIIFAVMIIAVLMTCAIPNAVRMIDRAALDYETKRLYSELHFLQAVNRVERVNNKGTGQNFAPTVYPVMKISTENFSYQILRGDVPLREAHQMHNIKTIEFNGNVSEKITFNDAGQATTYNPNPAVRGTALSGRITLTSRLDKPSAIFFDSVGRIHVEYGRRNNE